MNSNLKELNINEEFYFQWHITEKCNLRCQHCYHKGYSSDNELCLDDLIKIAKKIDTTLKKWGKIGSLSITGGEPFLLQEKLFNLLEEIDNLFSLAYFDVLTNGSLLDQLIVNKLKVFKKLRRVQLSIEAGHHETPSFAFIGKINHYWKYKSLDKIVNIFSGIKKDFKLFFIGQGIGYEDFSRYTAEQDLKTYTFRNFVHPANMPDLLANLDFILFFFRDNPIKNFSNIVCEALWSGIRLITDRTLAINEYTRYIEIEPEKQIINLAPEKIEAA